LLFLGCGPNSIRIAPPLVVSKEQADIALDVLEECIGIAAKEHHAR
jgi:4-aminobutyrate aminotransferase